MPRQLRAALDEVIVAGEPEEVDFGAGILGQRDRPTFFHARRRVPEAANHILEHGRVEKSGSRGEANRGGRFGDSRKDGLAKAPAPAESSSRRPRANSAAGRWISRRPHVNKTCGHGWNTSSLHSDCSDQERFARIAHLLFFPRRAAQRLGGDKCH